MSKPQVSKVISAKHQTVYDRYEMPNVKTRQQQQQEQVGMLTARQLDELQKQAYEEGFQQGREAGHEVGVQQGLEQGRQQGLAEGKEEVANMVKRFEQIMSFLSKPLDQVNQSVEQELLELAMATAKQIIRREIHVNPGEIVAVIKEAISILPAGANKIKVFLHPADAQIAREHLQVTSEKNLPADDEKSELWNIIEEPLLTRGGCRIETDVSQVDATIETRLAEIAARILGSERASNRHQESANDAEQGISESDSADIGATSIGQSEHDH